MDEDNVNVEQKEEVNEAQNNVDGERKLEKLKCYFNTMKKVESALEKGVLEDDELEYGFIDCCTNLSVVIDDEIGSLYCFIRDKSRRKLLDLELLPQTPVDFAAVVKKTRNEIASMIENEMDPKRRKWQRKIVDACDRVLVLDPANKKLRNLSEIQMRNFAPNLTAVVGGAVAARIVVTAGSLSELAELPGFIIELLGNGTRLPVTTRFHYKIGYLAQTEVSKRATSLAHRKRAFRLLGAKANVAAFVDSTKRDPSGEKGRALRAEIDKEMLVQIPDLRPCAGRKVGYLRSIAERNPEAASWVRKEMFKGQRQGLRKLSCSSENGSSLQDQHNTME